MAPRLALACALALALVCAAHGASSVKFMKVLPQPSKGSDASSMFVIKNTGGEPADLTGWSVVDKNQPGTAYYFGGDDGNMKSKPVKWCSNYTELASDEELALKPYDRNRFSDSFQPCGFRFGLGYDGDLVLQDSKGAQVDAVSWRAAKPGMAVYRMGDTFVPFMEDQDLKTSVENSPVLSIFSKALAKTGVMEKYLKYGSQINFKEGSWVNNKLKSEGYDKRYYKGPYTVFAPSNEAWKAFMEEMGWYGMALTEAELLAMPEIEDILKYHIVLGKHPAAEIANNTGYMSMKDGAELSVLRSQEGNLLLHDDCVDRPSPDAYGCKVQAAWGKCTEDWVQDEGIFSGRSLGYCERSCRRCTCEGEHECGQAELVDVSASNGIMHVIDHVLYPAVRFDIPDGHWRTKEEIEAEAEEQQGDTLGGLLNTRG